MTTIADFILARMAEDENYANYEAGWGRFGSDRVLAEREAKRRIVELHGRHDDEAHFDRWNRAERQMNRWRAAACKECGHFDENPVEWPCETLQALALCYADHADYRDEWRPAGLTS